MAEDIVRLRVLIGNVLLNVESVLVETDLSGAELVTRNVRIPPEEHAVPVMVNDTQPGDEVVIDAFGHEEGDTVLCIKGTLPRIN